MDEDSTEVPDGGTDAIGIGGRIADDLGAFVAASNDFYRGEVERATAWRARLDQTTNWAVVVVAAILTWAFSSTDNPHYVVLIGVFGVAAFLVMEANRYREYDIWRGRVRTLQEGLYANMYDPASRADTGWRDELSRDIRRPSFRTSFPVALGHRLRRSYLALLLVLLAAWVTRITVFEPGEAWHDTAAILGFPGEYVVAAVALFYLAALLVALWSATGGAIREFQE